MKDIFIDNNIAKNFTNPADPAYRSLVNWLMTESLNRKDFPTLSDDDFEMKRKQEEPHLVVSNKLLVEYKRSLMGCLKGTSMEVIMAFLIREGRVNKISNIQIKEFKSIHFTKQILRRLLSNEEDKDLIPVVLLSNRQIALTIDAKFTSDLLAIPKFSPTVSSRPEKINYK